MVEDENIHVHLDPGPGALIYSIWMKLSPRRLSGVFVSHCHLDHYADAEVMIEAMTAGMTRKRGTLVAPHSVLIGGEKGGPAISRYHQSMPKAVIDAAPDDRFSVDGLKVCATPAHHTDPNTIGFRFETRDVGDIGYTSDTEYVEGIGRHYTGTRLLLLCTLRPSGRSWRGHMTTDDAIKIVREAQPDAAIITHFGMGMLNVGPEKEARLVQADTGIPTLDAKDRMLVEVGEAVEVIYRGKRLVLA